MVLNVVLHRLNIDHVEQILDMARAMDAEYVELANTQYYGWAWHNRDQLLPSREQLRARRGGHQRFRERVGERMKIYFVVPDYYERRPKACMNGWGSVFLTITAGRHRASLSRGAHAAGPRVPQRARARPALDLVRLARFQPLSRRRAG